MESKATFKQWSRCLRAKLIDCSLDIDRSLQDLEYVPDVEQFKATRKDFEAFLDYLIVVKQGFYIFEKDMRDAKSKQEAV